MTAVAEVAAAGVHAAAEVHVVRAVATAVRGRPVVAVGTDIGERSSIAVACNGRQEYTTGCLKSGPSGRGASRAPRTRSIDSAVTKNLLYPNIGKFSPALLHDHNSGNLDQSQYLYDHNHC